MSDEANVQVHCRSTGDPCKNACDGIATEVLEALAKAKGEQQ